MIEMAYSISVNPKSRTVITQVKYQSFAMIHYGVFIGYTEKQAVSLLQKELSNDYTFSYEALEEPVLPPKNYKRPKQEDYSFPIQVGLVEQYKTLYKDLSDEQIKEQYYKMDYEAIPFKKQQPI